MSKAACMAPTASALSIVTARRSWRPTSEEASPGAPTTASAPTRTPSKVTAPKRRVRSTVSSASTVIPDAPAGTSTWVRPAPSRAVTRKCSAWPACSTGRTVPRNIRASPARSISTAVRQVSGRAPSSGAHHAAIASPDRSPASTSACSPSEPRSLRADATTFVAVSGPGAAWWPNSYATRLRSTSPAPLMEPPPCASSTNNDVQPSSAPRRQYARSKPSASSRRRRSASGGACSTRKRSVVARKNSCSSVGLISIWVCGPPSQRADSGGLVAPAPLVLRHPGHVDVAGHLTKGPDRGLLPRGVHERVRPVETARVLERDLVDLGLVGDPGLLELAPGELGRPRPRRVGMGVVALPRDVVDADPIAQQQARGVGEVAGEDVVAEGLRRELAAEVAVQPLLVVEVAVDAVEVEGDPADPALGQRDLELGETAQRGAEQEVLRGDGADLAGQHHEVVDRRLVGALDDREPGPDVQGQHHVLVAQRFEHRVPVARQEAREPLDVRRLEEADRPATLLGDAVHLFGGELDVPHRHDALGDEAVG